MDGRPPTATVSACCRCAVCRILACHLAPPSWWVFAWEKEVDGCHQSRPTSPPTTIHGAGDRGCIASGPQGAKIVDVLIHLNSCHSHLQYTRNMDPGPSLPPPKPHRAAAWPAITSSKPAGLSSPDGGAEPRHISSMLL